MKAKISTIYKKNRIIIVPDILKDERTKVKFCYLALRNLIYYIDKGITNQTKHTKESKFETISQMIKSYIQLLEDNKCLTSDEISKLKELLTKENVWVIPNNDYIRSIEKALIFNQFAFYCNCIVELSFHITEEYFTDDYIRDTVKELSNKMLANVGEDFITFIITDINETLEEIENLKGETK